MKFILVALFVLALGFVATKALANSERAECVKWQAQASEIVGWYSTDWQKQQCVQFGISFTK